MLNPFAELLRRWHWRRAQRAAPGDPTPAEIQRGWQKMRVDLVAEGFLHPSDLELAAPAAPPIAAHLATCPRCTDRRLELSSPRPSPPDPS